MNIGDIEKISSELARLFPSKKFLLQKDEYGTKFAYVVKGDGHGILTAGLPAESEFRPGCHYDFNVTVKIIEGTGFFHYLGFVFPYSQGSVFNVLVGNNHCFADVMTHTIFTKTFGSGRWRHTPRIQLLYESVQ